MSNAEESYNLPEIRKLLATVFDDIELSALCLDHFSVVYDKFSDEMRKDQKINLLLDHCRRDESRSEKLLEIVRDKDAVIFKRFEPYLRSTSSTPRLVSNVVSQTDFGSLFDELIEWKFIHNDVQELLNRLDTPLYFLTSYRFKADADMLDQAGYKWQELCVHRLKLIPDKWALQHAYSPELSILQEKTTHINQITRKFMGDINETEFKSLFAQFTELRGILWDVLIAADKRIMILIQTMQRNSGG